MSNQSISLFDGVCVLALLKVVEISLLLEQLLVRTALHNFAVIDHEDQIGTLH